MSTRPTLFVVPTIEVDQDKYDKLVRISERYELLKSKEKDEEEIIKTKVSQEDIDELLDKAQINIETILNKCTVVTVELENGFILTESSACIDSKNYDEEIGKQICLEKIENKLWELEGYKLQDKIFKEEK